MRKLDWEVSLKYKGVPFCKKKGASTEELEDIFDIAKLKAK